MNFAHRASSLSKQQPELRPGPSRIPQRPFASGELSSQPTKLARQPALGYFHDHDCDSANHTYPRGLEGRRMD